MSVRKTQAEKDYFYKTKVQNEKQFNQTMTELSDMKALEKDIEKYNRNLISRSLSPKKLKKSM